MTSFISKQIKGESFGETLKKRRLELGYSLEQVSQKLRIKKSYLRALESEDLRRLPPPVYVQGFLRRYSRFLKLNQEVILKRYQTERNILDNLSPAESLVYKSKIKRISPVAISPRLVKVGLIILAVLGFFVYLGWEFSGFSAPPTLEIIAPQDNEKINSDSVVIVGQTDQGAELFINGQPVFIDPKGNFREQLILPEGLNIIEILSKNRLGRERKVERKILVSLPPGAATPHKEETAAASKEPQGLTLTIRIKDSATWISVETDGANAFQGTMLPDTSQEFKAEDKISITSGKAGNTYVIFNGKDLGSLGDPGEVVRDVEFTRDLELEKILD